ncbi:carbohydrate esterase family 4 protein [Zasmidium cellare ATCC 36951]|uniref:Carbohydrate esterase family 4 protein n=1 Tax=Zasmidium cellare ATCC 36951 TaxID=1080233 RepID=A0A6A6CD66_ZASCE|nr:carbohydrate esterase family 4 protein [Zasmidium cellare ATCC 36951]KAF2165134.1 carbohydrate esterase family 4 protein [Zasmidium cellare ATCC 36951]
MNASGIVRAMSFLWRRCKFDFPRDLKGYGRHPPNPQWPNNAKIAVSFVINYEEGAERTVLNGDATSESSLWEQTDRPGRPGERAFNSESDYEYGSRVGIWRILDTFEAHRMPVTVYAVGQALEMNPEVVPAFREGGHEIASHAYRWIDYHAMDEKLEKEYILRQLKCLKEVTGEYPVGWYYGRLSPRSKALVWEAYKQLGIPLLWESDSYCDDLPYWVDVPAEKDVESPEGMLMVPYSYDCNDLKYHSTTGAFSPHAFFEHLAAAFDTLYAEGLAGKPKMMTVGLHCRITGKPARAMALKRFVEYVASKPDVWVTTRKDIAAHWRGKYPYHKGHL